MPKILLAGDFSLQKRAISILNEDISFSSFKTLRDLFNKYDYSIINLESVITDGNYNSIKKSGPSIATDELSLKLLSYLGVNSVTLANNHLRDFGNEGINNTIKLCKKYNINTIGGGDSLLNASRIKCITIRDKKIAFINCCEEEYSIATKYDAGANPLDVISIYKQIQEAKNISDYVILVIHGGIEHYNLPTPRMQRQYRFFVDVGADLVVNHHQHCYSGYELYNGKYIVYGLGNFIFDWDDVDENWNFGYLLGVNLNDTISIELIPYKQNDGKELFRFLYESEKVLFYDTISVLNEVIKSSVDLESKYNDFVSKNYSLYELILNFHNHPFFAKLANKGLLPGCFSVNKLLNLKCIITCESHRDRLVSYINSVLKKC